jgi:ornithine cyclodeaminase/alanine dehydrogenase-like protein (mu-crystallin family)
VQILSVEETCRVLSYTSLMDEIGRAVDGLQNGTVTASERTALHLPGGAVLLYMPVTDGEIAAVKLLSVHPDNPSHGLPSIHAEVIIMDAKTGKRLCLLDGSTVTSRRTAAVTLYGASRLGCTAPRRVLVVGTGTQAREHVKAIAEVCKPERIYSAGLTRRLAEDFVAALGNEVPSLASVGQADEVRKEVDMIVTLTTSKVPVISPDIPDSTLVVGVGAFRPDMIELPPELIRRRKVLVDHWESARQEAGDLLNAGIDWNSVLDFSSLAESEDDRPTILKTVGHAAWDLAAARLVIARIGQRSQD